MTYVGWALVAMAAYGVTAALLKVALKDLTPGVAVVITNLVLVAAGAFVAVYRGEEIADQLNLGVPLLVALAAGVALSVGVVCYYIALSKGPVSVVVPIFAMYLVIATAIGVGLLGEEFKLTKALGAVLAVGAIILLTR